MNYIELINNFWSIRRSNRITSLEADLYFFLIHESNMRNWQNPFYCSNGMICATIGIAENSLIRARIKLSELGLIDFKGGEKNKSSPHYYLKFCGNNVSKKGGNNVSKDVSNSVSRNANYNTINKTKQNNTIKLKFNYREKLLEIVKDQTLVDDYLQVRKVKRLPMTETVFNQLVKECEDNQFDISSAVKICAERGWAGFKYEWVKNQNNSGRTPDPTKPKTATDEEIQNLINEYK